MLALEPPSFVILTGVDASCGPSTTPVMLCSGCGVLGYIVQPSDCDDEELKRRTFLGDEDCF